MTRHTTLSLFAAAAFGLVMAVSTASGQPPADPPTTPERGAECWIARFECIRSCFNNSNTPEDRAACEGRCNAILGPDCVQPARQPLGAARVTAAPQRTVSRRP